MRRLLAIPLSLILTVTVLLPSCSPSDRFDGGRPITPEDLESISAEVFGSTDEPADESETKEIHSNTTVYWLADGSVYHTNSDCSHLKGKRNVKQTTLRTAETNGLRLCKDCEKK